jgi:hypothetical protein
MRNLHRDEVASQRMPAAVGPGSVSGSLTGRLSKRWCDARSFRAGSQVGSSF